MGFMDNFKNEISDSQRDNLGVIYSKLKSLLEQDTTDEKVRYIAAVCGLLGKVAYADLDISAYELLKIKKILKKTTTLSEHQIEAVSKIVSTETKTLAGLEDHLYTREINDLATKDQKGEILLTLFMVAAADENVSSEESATIKSISSGLRLSKSEYTDVRSLFKKYLSEFK
jgi:uncharacterized tellurite resistance protein B-like protein